MKRFNIIITETLTEIVTVESDSFDDALDIVKSRYSQEEIVLGSDNFVAVDFDETDVKPEEGK